MINQAATAILIVNIIGIIFLWKRNQNLLYAIFGVSLLSLFVLTVAKEYTPEWRVYQSQYIKQLIEKETNPETIATLKRKPIKIKQIWNNELGIADRCTSCHLAVDNPLFKGAPEPFRFHAAAREHDFHKIGCTVCHRGQGRATETIQAHAKGIMHWEEPMWDPNMVQISCPQCHEQIYRTGYKLKGAEILMQGRDLTVKNEMDIECVSCHTIRGVGEVIAPNLSAFGKLTEHAFARTHEMKHVEGKKNKYNWTFQHFLNPEKITPGDPKTGQEPTIMPNFELTKEQARSLVVFVFSLEPSNIPAKYLYSEPTLRDKELMAKPSFIKSFEATFDNFDDLPPGQKLFIASQCWFCHKINGKGGRVGPDLSKIGAKKSRKYLVKFFKSMDRHKEPPMAGRFKFQDQQIDDLVSYLVSLK